MKKLYKNKEFIWALTKRELKGKYKQSLLGKLWIFLQPFSLMLILSFVFSQMVRLDSEGLPYPVFLFAGLLPMIFFQNTISSSANIITGKASLIKQKFFMREALVINKLFTEVINLFFGSLGFILILLYYQIQIGIYSMFVLIIFPIQLMFMYGLMLILSSLNVYIRDVEMLTPLIIRLWYYLTPVIYSYSSIPNKYKVILALNPMTGIIDGYRKALLHNTVPDIGLLLYSLGIGLVVFFVGSKLFSKLEKYFSDAL
ncbi:ABC transporter permease [Paenibacillus tarimensis]